MARGTCIYVRFPRVYSKLQLSNLPKHPKTHGVSFSLQDVYYIDPVQLSFYDSLNVRRKVPDLNKLQEETAPENITISPCMILTWMFRRTSGHHNDGLCYTTGISNTQVVRVCFRGSNQWRWQPPQKKGVFKKHTHPFVHRANKKVTKRLTRKNFNTGSKSNMLYKATHLFPNKVVESFWYLIKYLHIVILLDICYMFFWYLISDDLQIYILFVWI